MLNEHWQVKLNKALEFKRQMRPREDPPPFLPALPRIIHQKYDVTKNTYTVVPENGHWTVYENGKFYCTADTKEEAYREVP